jgi:hypothetical protein
VEPKTLGWENSRKSFENGFENLGVVPTPLKCFLNDFWDKWKLGIWRKGVGGFGKRHWCFFVVARSNLTVQPHYPVWDGLSLKFICFSAGSLTTI